MKTLPLTITALLACAAVGASGAQASTNGFGMTIKRPALQNSAARQQLAAQTRVIGERTANSRTWFNVTTVTNARGQVITKTNKAYVEIATGMHYTENGGLQRNA